MKNVKVSLIGVFDMLKFKNLKTNRQKMIEASSAEALPSSFRINEMARIYHPERQHLKISRIVEENGDSKTFFLAPDEKKGTRRLAPFKAGSYVNLSLKIGASVASRSYSLSSSPKEALAGEYSVTIKRKVGGFFSEYMLSSARVGDSISCSEPFGRMTYNRIRDARTVVALAGGTGITPFYSMAKAIEDGTEDFDMILLYGIRRKEDILFSEGFERIEKATGGKFKVVYVFSEVEQEGCEKGFITSELIKKYAPEGEYSIFAAGPGVMLSFLDKELVKLGKEKKYLRLERTGEDQEEQEEPRTYKITLNFRDRRWEIDARSDETILTAIERSGYAHKNMCRLGGCGYCRSRLVSGNYRSTKYERLRLSDPVYHYFHPCCSYPLSDMEIVVNAENEL